MLSTSLQRRLPYSSEQLFDIAADIERYPDFLPWWRAATVCGRDGQHLCVDNAVALGPLRLRFRSQARLQRPERIEVSSTEEPFELLQLTWQFQPLGAAGCELRLSVQIAMRSMLMQLAVGSALRSLLADVAFAFESRARALYDQPSEQPGDRTGDRTGDHSA